MIDISDINLSAASDAAIMVSLGAFIRHHRLKQNKSQFQLASEAGIARSTLSLCEKGENTSLLVFIQLLRALKLLQLFNEFRVSQEVSPLLLAKLEQSKRKRVKGKGDTRKRTSAKPEW